MMTQTTPQTHYIVQTASAKMPTSCWGRYRHVAVLEVDEDRDEVSMISERARGCHRIVRTWERRNVGTTERCAYERALVKAEELAEELNRAALDQADWAERHSAGTMACLLAA